MYQQENVKVGGVIPGNQQQQNFNQGQQYQQPYGVPQQQMYIQPQMQGQPYSQIPVQQYQNQGQPNLNYPTEVIVIDNNLPMQANGIPFPTRIRCPNCRQEVVTAVTTSPGAGTWCCCILIFLIGPCCCIPFFVDDCQDKIHACPKCMAKVGIKEYKPCG